MEMLETFESPLISADDDEEYKKDVADFLASFSIEERTEEIAKLLEENPETLKIVFEALVPTKVKYEDFWQRYFYRCDEERINTEIEEEDLKAEASRASAFQSISAVGNLFTGAVKAVSSSLSEGEGNTQGQKKTVANSGFFGASKRPPFVLNTAVDEDGDEEEEELGWDDDEGEEADGEGQIEFNDVATENLRGQLRLAVEERDQLHQTIEMQKKEIASLKKPGIDNAEIGKLKTQLFEKESELAALRASALDNSTLDVNTGSLDITNIEDLGQKLQNMEKKAQEDKNALDVARTENEELALQLSALKSASKQLEEKLRSLEVENGSLKSKLGDAEKRVRTLEAELQRVEKEEPGEASVDSPDTASSGVKIDRAAAIPKSADDWDDDW